MCYTVIVDKNKHVQKHRKDYLMSNEIREAINQMLFETCGEDPELVANAEIEELAENNFHVTYKKYDPWDGLDFKFTVEPIQDTYHFNIYESVYADTGEFDL